MKIQMKEQSDQHIREKEKQAKHYNDKIKEQSEKHNTQLSGMKRKHSEMSQSSDAEIQKEKGKYLCWKKRN